MIITLSIKWDSNLFWSKLNIFNQVKDKYCFVFCYFIWHSMAIDRVLNKAVIAIFTAFVIVLFLDTISFFIFIDLYNYFNVDFSSCFILAVSMRDLSWVGCTPHAWDPRFLFVLHFLITLLYKFALMADVLRSLNPSTAVSTILCVS